MIAVAALLALYPREGTNPASWIGAQPAASDRLDYATLLPELTNDITAWTTTAAISGDLLRGLMEEDVRGRQFEIDRVRIVKGEAAAREAEDSIRAPYRRKLQEMAAAGKPLVHLDIRMVTLGSRLSFSTLSYDGALTPKDPVSTLFYGNARVETVYDRLTRPVECQDEGCSAAPAPLIDHDGPTGVNGLRPCRSQTQWILAASYGEDLHWVRSSRGVMGEEGGCAAGMRDHVRLFGDLEDAEYGSWFLATPHREEWSNGGHVIRSWQAPASTFLDGWTARADLSGFSTATGGRSWALCDVRSEGVYQNVPWNGEAAVIVIP